MGIPLKPSQSVAALTPFTEALNEVSRVTLPAEGSAFATGLLDYTADVTLTKNTIGTANNTRTFKTVVNAPAANPSATVLFAFTGTAAAIICTVTPNDGTHNSAAPVTVTTANLVQLINTGLITGKTPTITDASTLRTKQTATGGGTTPMAASGEGDNVTATFAGGLASALNSKYLLFATGADAPFYAWFNVNSEGVDPAPAGTGIAVLLAGGETAAAVGAALAAAVDLDSHFDADDLGNGVVQIENSITGASTDAGAGNAPVTIETVQQGQAETYSPSMSPAAISNNPT